MNIISGPLFRVALRAAKVIGKEGAVQAAKLNNGILLQDAFQKNFRTLAKEVVGGKELGIMGAITARTKAYFALITKSVKSLYNTILNKIKNGTGAKAPDGTPGQHNGPQQPT